MRILALVLAAAAASILPGSGQGISLVLDEATIRPYHLARGSIVSDFTPASSLRIKGRNWDDSVTTLFEAPEPAGPEVIVAFHVGKDLRSLILEERRGKVGWRAIEEIELPPDAMAITGSAMPTLPFHQARLGFPAATFDPGGTDGASIARRAWQSLAVSPPPLASALVLLLSCLLCSLAALPSVAGRTARRGRTPLAPFLCLGILAAGLPLALALLPPRAELFVVTLPSPPTPPGTNLLQLVQHSSRGYVIHAWGRTGGTRLLAARTPPGQPLPLELLLGVGASRDPRLVFDPQPLVSNLDGELFLAFPGLGRAWSVDDAP